ncbi:hypothetical protein HWV62_13126 [Athelia sp. TMB]|nr:hypothetical protein HWV62_13126 [Athelia sp. TMB]
MTSPTSTSFDFESDTSPDTAPPMPSTRSRHYFPGTLTVFKVGGHLFRINRALLDDEGAAIPGGVGSEDDPIELTYIRAADLEILLDFLSLGCADIFLFEIVNPEKTTFLALDTTRSH